MESTANTRASSYTTFAMASYAARHTYAGSNDIVRINAALIKLRDGEEEIMPMTLNEAATFIENLLTQWLKYRTIHF